MPKIKKRAPRYTGRLRHKTKLMPTHRGNAFYARMVRMGLQNKALRKCPRLLFQTLNSFLIDPSDAAVTPRWHRAKRAPRCTGALSLQKTVGAPDILHYFAFANEHQGKNRRSHSLRYLLHSSVSKNNSCYGSCYTCTYMYTYKA